MPILTSEAKGQQTMAESVPVVVASDQSDIPVTLNGEEVTISGSVLPAGAATSANQTAQITAEQAIQDALNRVLVHVNIDFSDAAAQTIVAGPAAGYRIRVVSLELSALVNVEIAVKSGATTIRTFQGAVMIWAPPTPANLGEAEALVLDAVTDDRITGGVSYYVEAI
ncbi:MAG: hypothetical protein PHI12_15195 [Dehalococcoidales bacterium]|nr:hypothetical protein [Dehalococcoidales bacterium]